MGKFVGWLAGLLAAIIAGYAVWYFTRPPATTTFEGLVYSSSSAVPKAMVSIELTGDGLNSGSFHNVTDENGSYRIDFTGLPSSASAIVSVVATGFQDSASKSLSKPLGPDNRQDFALTPLAATINPGNGPVVIPPAVSHIPVYVRKGAEQAVQVRLQAKP